MTDMTNVARYKPVVHSYFHRTTTEEKIAMCTLDYARSLFFVLDTGEVYWKHHRPLWHFRSKIRHQIWTSRCAGRLAGVEKTGQILIPLPDGTHLGSNQERLRHFLRHGVWPVKWQ
jgi:hypothetical protein